MTAQALPDPAAPAAVPSTFPEGFLWGAATSAYQIEGGTEQDGRGRSVWDDFVLRPGAIEDGSTGVLAADHRNRYVEDVALMEWMGLRAYRFSISWPRVQPGGRGPANAAGLDFYDRLVDELCSRQIAPMATLFHWDLPSELQAAQHGPAGWAARDTAARFADYAALVYERLGDRVQQWVTVNEPRTYAFVGHSLGIHAPGRQSYPEACAVVHHLLLGHGLAIQAMRAIGGAAQFGFAPDPAPVVPAGRREPDRDVARRIDGLVNRMYLDPVLLGHYPADLREDLGPHLEHVIRDGDEKVIAAPVDFLGVNYYRPYVVRAGDPGRADPEAPSLWPGAEHVQFVDNARPKTDNGWNIDAAALRELLAKITNDYPPVPLYITENGAAYNDPLRHGTVQDDRRVDYLDQHIRAVAQAIGDGADVRGYFVWSLLDNFEWERGYSQRFGLVHVDFDTLARTPKASAGWYRQLIQANRLPQR